MQPRQPQSGGPAREQPIHALPGRLLARSIGFLALPLLVAVLAVAAVPSGSARAQGWWNPWAEQRPPVPRENVRPQPPPVQQPSDEDLELDREMEYLVEPEEAEARGITEVE